MIVNPGFTRNVRPDRPVMAPAPEAASPPPPPAPRPEPPPAVDYAAALAQYQRAQRALQGPASSYDGNQSMESFLAELGLLQRTWQGDAWGSEVASPTSQFVRQVSASPSYGDGWGGSSDGWEFDKQGYVNSILAGMDPVTQARVSGPAAQWFGASQGQNVVGLHPEFIRYMDASYGPSWADNISAYSHNRPPGTEGIKIGGSIYGHVYYPTYGVGTGLQKQFADDPVVQNYLNDWMSNIEQYATQGELGRRGSGIKLGELFNIKNYNPMDLLKASTRLPTFKNWNEPANIGDAVALGPATVAMGKANLLPMARQIGTMVGSSFAGGAVGGAAGGGLGGQLANVATKTAINQALKARMDTPGVSNTSRPVRRTSTAGRSSAPVGDQQATQAPTAPADRPVFRNDAVENRRLAPGFQRQVYRG